MAAYVLIPGWMSLCLDPHHHIVAAGIFLAGGKEALDNQNVDRRSKHIQHLQIMA